MRQGDGILWYANGDKYQGNWKANYPVGIGKITFFEVEIKNKQADDKDLINNLERMKKISEVKQVFSNHKKNHSDNLSEDKNIKLLGKIIDKN